MSFSERLPETDCLSNYYCNELHLMDHISYFVLLAAIVTIFSKHLLQYADG